MSSARTSRLHDAATLLVIAGSGNLILNYFGGPIGAFIPFAGVALLALVSGMSFKRSDAWLLLGFAAVTVVHLIAFGVQILPSTMSIGVRLATALLAVRVIPEFFSRVVKVMYWLAAISLVFHLPVLLGVDMSPVVNHFSIPLSLGPLDIHKDITGHLIVHYYRQEVIEGESLDRNSGMFWEPGAFAGYLVLALLLASLSYYRLTRKQLVVIVLALLTTRSTTGYVALALLALGYTLFSGRSKLGRSFVFKVVAGCALPLTFYAVYSNTSFLEAKVAYQFSATEAENNTWEITRFGNAIYDWGYFLQRPLTGWSLSNTTRPGEEEILLRQGNALTGLPVRLGLPAALLVLSLILRFFRLSGAWSPLWALAVICCLLVGEQFILYPLFLAMLVRPVARVASRPQAAVRPSLGMVQRRY
ncbi:hypothetical protein [Ramlibacter sp.]|uniref:hypothetical protein n=1 Tax=Ramlibacter sp. TaxID=1917967 RepID=UPI00260BDA07|nr:hypothetical protein [Ramlibacter sp.]MDB5957082.1 hypothetical protein [Ramlibacter sp.]